LASTPSWIGFEKASSGLWTPDETGLAAHVSVDALLFFGAAVQRAMRRGATAMVIVAAWWVSMSVLSLEPDIGPMSYALTQAALIRAAMWLNDHLP
jgi:hypothetical protein